MSIIKTLGGDRLGSGKKLKVELHNYERSTHDMGYIWRSTMSAGTLVPFLTELALPGDTFDINLDADIKTHPTIGPLFGSYKIQLDVFQAPIRLYQGQLHNNKLGIGLNMASVKLPQMELFVDPTVNVADSPDPDNAQINPSCILSYLNIRGVGTLTGAHVGLVAREFNAVPLLAYWDIYKNYYANKQEELGWFIHTPLVAVVVTVDSITINGDTIQIASPGTPANVEANVTIVISYTGATPIAEQILFYTSSGIFPLNLAGEFVSDSGTVLTYTWKIAVTGPLSVSYWNYIEPGILPVGAPGLESFNLTEIDDMREEILLNTANTSAYLLNDFTGADSPYRKLLDWSGSLSPYIYTQQGLGLKTYQSDLFNNWLRTEWIDGTGGINDITAIDTSGGSFNIDTLNLSKKVYDMLNRIAVSGGSYDDWVNAVWAHERFNRAETPIYHGGLIKELVFQEVVSNSESTGGENPSQPLGTLAGKGIMAKKHKGGNITIKVDEPSYIMGIISLTPRIDYSTGNKWDTQLKTLDDLHKPALDQIGFQELIQEQMAWWTTENDFSAPGWETKSAGKQPAWINYMTNVNQTRGNFAIKTNEMFMTLNRRYEWAGDAINDLTTYIDPTKFNNIFAQTSIDAMNFWAQIAVDITARRKMSAKVMPNL